jgi:hypothetical protein
MDAKLTLKLNRHVIKKAKEYASEHNRSLSRLIESYLMSLTRKEVSDLDDNEIPISSFVKSMSSGIHIPTDLDDKREYSNQLMDKYK